MARCHDELIQLYVDGALDPTERALVSAHMSQCEACRAKAMLYKGLCWDLEHPEPEPVPEALQAVSDRVMAKWEEAQARSRAKARWQELPAMWAAANPALGAVSGTVNAAASQMGKAAAPAGKALLKRLTRLLWKRQGGR